MFDVLMMIYCLLAYIVWRKDVPKHFVAMRAKLVNASINEVIIFKYLLVYFIL